MKVLRSLMFLFAMLVLSFSAVAHTNGTTTVAATTAAGTATNAFAPVSTDAKGSCTACTDPNAVQVKVDLPAVGITQPAPQFREVTQEVNVTVNREVKLLPGNTSVQSSLPPACLNTSGGSGCREGVKVIQEAKSFFCGFYTKGGTTIAILNKNGVVQVVKNPTFGKKDGKTVVVGAEGDIVFKQVSASQFGRNCNEVQKAIETKAWHILVDKFGLSRACQNPAENKRVTTEDGQFGSV